MSRVYESVGHLAEEGVKPDAALDALVDDAIMIERPEFGGWMIAKPMASEGFRVKRNGQRLYTSCGSVNGDDASHAGLARNLNDACVAVKDDLGRITVACPKEDTDG